MKLIWFDKIDSTQDYIKSHINELWDDTWVIANTQTKGRGRYSHVWYSTEGGLYFSLLKKNLNIPVLSLIIGVSIFKTIQDIYNITPLIKWPNDIYVFLEKPKKVSGILIEKIKEDTIIGVGVNLNQEDFPDDIQATSLKLFSGKYIDKKIFLINFMKNLYNDLEYYSVYGFEDFRKIINNHLLYKDKNITANSGKISGVLKEVDENGYITIKTQDKLLKLNAGEIEMLREYNIW